MKIKILMSLFFFASFSLSAQQVENITLRDSTLEVLQMIENGNGDLVCLYEKHIVKSKNTWGIILYNKNFTEVWNKEISIPHSDMERDRSLRLFVGNKSIYFLHEKYNKTEKQLMIDKYDFDGNIQKEKEVLATMKYEKYTGYNSFYFGQSSDKKKILVCYLENAIKGLNISLKCSVFNDDFSTFYDKVVSFPYNFGDITDVGFDVRTVSNKGELFFGIDLTGKNDYHKYAIYYYDNLNASLTEMVLDEKIKKQSINYFIDDASRRLFISSFYYMDTKGISGHYLNSYSLDNKKSEFEKTIPFNDKDMALLVGEKAFKTGAKPYTMKIDGVYSFKNKNVCILSHYYINHATTHWGENSFGHVGWTSIVSETKKQGSIICMVLNPQGELVYENIFFRNWGNKNPYYVSVDMKSDTIHCIYGYIPLQAVAIQYRKYNIGSRILMDKDNVYVDDYIKDFPNQKLDDTKPKFIFQEIGSNSVKSKFLDCEDWLLNGFGPITLSDKAIIIQKENSWNLDLLRIKY